MLLFYVLILKLVRKQWNSPKLIVTLQEKSIENLERTKKSEQFTSPASHQPSNLYVKCLFWREILQYI